MNEEPVIEINNVSKSYRYDGNRTDAIRGVTLQAHKGEMVLLLGPSGSGKTTLINLMAGLLEPTGGEVLLFGKKISDRTKEELRQLRARRIGLIFQTFLLFDVLTALENVALALRFAGKSARTAREAASQILKEVGIEHLKDKYPPTLSHGEQQRVAVARAIANRTEIILADEPTASLDTNTGLEIIRLLHRYAADFNICIIVASHDSRMADYATRIVHLTDGTVRNGQS